MDGGDLAGPNLAGEVHWAFGPKGGPKGGMDRLQPGRTASNLPGMPPRPGEQHLEPQPEAGAVERVLLVPKQRLERLQACILLGLRHLMWRAGGRGSRA